MRGRGGGRWSMERVVEDATMAGGRVAEAGMKGEADTGCMIAMDGV